MKISRAFLRGINTVGLFGIHLEYDKYKNLNSTRDAIRGDWKNVGQDIRKSIRRYREFSYK